MRQDTEDTVFTVVVAALLSVMVFVLLIGVYVLIRSIP